MGRYSNEIAYDRNNGNVTHKTLTIRIMKREYNKDSSNIHIVKEGDTLFSIAKLYYGDFRKWYMIADKNPLITNPFILDNGTELIIPNVDGSVLNE